MKEKVGIVINVNSQVFHIIQIFSIFFPRCATQWRVQLHVTARNYETRPRPTSTSWRYLIIIHGVHCQQKTTYIWITIFDWQRTEKTKWGRVSPANNSQTPGDFFSFLLNIRLETSLDFWKNMESTGKHKHIIKSKFSESSSFAILHENDSLTSVLHSKKFWNESNEFYVMRIYFQKAADDIARHKKYSRIRKNAENINSRSRSFEESTSQKTSFFCRFSEWRPEYRKWWRSLL